MRLHFGHLLGLIAIAIGGCAAYFSVFGISKLFAGAYIAAIIMATVLELGKFAGATYVQRYRKTASKANILFVTICVGVLMIITSAGIYGFLSSAFQGTYQKFEVSENELKFLAQKEQFFADDIARFDNEMTQISDNISTLSNAKTQQIQVRDTSSTSGLRNTISTAELRAAQQRISIEEENKLKIRESRRISNDSLQKYQLLILEKQNNSEITSELGPLKYISDLTGWSMPRVVNYFILLLIFVFDPLAVALVIATSWIFTNENKKRLKEQGIIEAPITPEPIIKTSIIPEPTQKDSKFKKVLVNIGLFKPKTPTEEPKTPIEELKTATEELKKTAIEELKTATEEPKTATEEPKTATEEPKTATEEPKTATEEPNPNIGVTKITPPIEPSDLPNNNPHENTKETGNRNFSRRIPARRGY